MFKLCLGLCKKHTFPVCPIKQAFRFSVCSQMGTGELKFSAWSLLLEDGPLVYVSFTGLLQVRSFWKVSVASKVEKISQV